MFSNARATGAQVELTDTGPADDIKGVARLALTAVAAGTIDAHMAFSTRLVRGGAFIHI